ncbi:hypothetical protein Plec18167_001435 [Paecilomyces lecythidis]|uniref:STEEP1 domain-containing protein n=1 Tax=Paecilomyces lecythidis TaxID=3004212 RepID=A0ABR3YER5_9EURO
MASTEPTESATTTPNPVAQTATEQDQSPTQNSQEKTPSHEVNDEQIQDEKPNPRPRRPRKPIHTHHCRFCSHLLLATTRDLTQLRRRREPAQDQAFILPISSSSGDAEGSDSESESESKSKTETDKDGKTKRKETDYTILLSTLLPDRKHTIIRRADGFEKRLLLRCGRCRVVIGYFLDNAHFKQQKGPGAADTKIEGGEEEGEDEAKVVYLLPGGLVKTEQLDVNAEDVELKLESDREWRGWLKGDR